MVLVGAPSIGGFFFTYIERPASTRLVWFDVDTANARILKGLQGELEESFFDAKTKRLHALTSHGLFEVGLEPFAIRRRLAQKIATYPRALIPASDGERLAISWISKATCDIVDPKTYTVAGKVRFSGLEAIFPWRGKPTFFSFVRGAAQREGKAFDVPSLGPSLVADDGVYGIDEQKIVALDRRTLEVRGEKIVGAVEHLPGVDDRGRLVAVTSKAVLLVDRRSLEIVQAIDAPDRTELFRRVLAGPSTVVALTAQRESRGVALIEWGKDARRPVVATAPIAVPKPPPPKTLPTGRIVIAKQTFHDVTHTSAVPSGVDLERCTFDWVSVGTEAERVVVRDVRAIRCVFRNAYARGVVFEDCVLDTPKATKMQKLTGCMFKHVVVRGDPGLCLIEGWAGNEGDGMTAEEARARDAAVLGYYEEVDWAIDVREADVGSFRMFSVPLHLVRRDPEKQLLVWKKHATHPVWRSAALAQTIWPGYAEGLASSGREGMLLTIDAGKRAADESAAAAALRKAGVVDDQTGVVAP